MGLLEKIRNKAKTGLAVIVTGAMISGVAYAKEINDKGWPVPDETKYSQTREPVIGDIQCEYEGKTINVKIKSEFYASTHDPRKRGYQTFIFEDKVFMYVIIEAEGNSDAYNLTILADRDGNGSMETKYTDPSELEQEGVIPQWVIDKSIKK